MPDPEYADHELGTHRAGELAAERAARFEREVEEGRRRSIRGKWVMDGAETLPDAAAKLRRYADVLEEMHGQGWRLDGPVADDHGDIVLPEP